MGNKYIDEILPKMNSIKGKLDRGEDISGAEIKELKDAISKASNEPLPSKADLQGAQVRIMTPCVACAMCGWLDPPFLGFLSAL